MYYFGIDFGTTNCRIAYAVDDPRQQGRSLIAVDVIPFEVSHRHGAKSFRLPSLVAVDGEDDRPVFGWDLLARLWRRRRARPRLACGTTFFPSVKSDLGANKVYVHARPALRIPTRVAAGLLEQLLAAARRAIPGLDPAAHKFVITVPASALALARADTLQAAVRAGLPEEHLELLDEPIAALLDGLNDVRAAAFLGAEPKHILVFDYGGGTCDLSLFRAQYDARAGSGLNVVNLAISRYTRLGGDDVDRAIMAQVVWPALGGREALDVAVAHELEDVLTCTVARRLKERLCDRMNAYLNSHGGAWDAGLAALASEPTEIPFPIEELPGHPRRLTLSYAQFERLMRPLVELPADPAQRGASLCGLVLDVLAKAGLPPPELQVLVLHGGSCRNPFVRRLLEECFGRQGDLFARLDIRTTPDLDASVARGAALHAYWKHARRETLVAPITSEALGLRTLGDVDRPLVPAGCRLPYPAAGLQAAGETFYVPAAGLAEMIVPYCVGEQPRPRLAGAVKIPLAPGTAKGTPVHIRLQITANKTLRWRFRVGDAPETEAPAVDNPWTREELTPEVQRLLHVREALRAAVERQQTPLTWQILDEIWQLCRLGGEHLAEAWREAAGFVKAHPQVAEGWNLMGCLFDERHRTDEKIHCLQRAIDLAPGEPTYRNNLAWALIARQRFDEALMHLRTALETAPQTPYLYEALGALYRRQGQEAAALREFREGIGLLERRPHGQRDGRDWQLLASLYHNVADHASAARARGGATQTAAAELIGGRPEHVIASEDSGLWPACELRSG